MQQETDPSSRRGSDVRSADCSRLDDICCRLVAAVNSNGTRGKRTTRHGSHLLYVSLYRQRNIRNIIYKLRVKNHFQQ